MANHSAEIERVAKIAANPDLLSKLVDVITNLDEEEFHQAVELATHRSRQRQYEAEQEQLRAQMQAELENEIARLGTVDATTRAALSGRLAVKYRAKGLGSGKLLSEFLSEKEQKRRTALQSLSPEEFQRQQRLWGEYRKELMDWKAGGALSASREMMILNQFKKRGLRPELFDAEG